MSRWGTAANGLLSGMQGRGRPAGATSPSRGSRPGRLGPPSPGGVPSTSAWAVGRHAVAWRSSFVVTHRTREDLLGDNGGTFAFDGLEAAAKRAKDAAGDKDVWTSGGMAQRAPGSCLGGAG